MDVDKSGKKTLLLFVLMNQANLLQTWHFKMLQKILAQKKREMLIEELSSKKVGN